MASQFGNDGELGSHEERPLLQTEPSGETQGKQREEALTSGQLWGVYLSHFFSTWNSRCYEFAAILFTASAYPNTLAASSIRGLLANLSTLCLSSTVGHWADRHPSRLRSLQITILLQRLFICLACIGWTFIVSESFVGSGFTPQVPDKSRNGNSLKEVWWTKNTIMAAVVVLGIGERLSAVGNMLIMERDWVPTLATPTSKPPLHVLNASMRRIDLISKLVAPIFISLTAMLVRSLRMTTLVVAGMNVLFVVPELFFAKQCWCRCSRLRETSKATAVVDDHEADERVNFEPAAASWGKGFKLYFGSDVWIPSLSLALQSFSVLSLSASMTTYLLTIHYTLPLITLARTLTAVTELSSTILMPWAVFLLSTPGADPLIPLSCVGLWGLNLQCLTLLLATFSLLLIPTSSASPASSFPVLTATLFFFLALSRLGLSTYSLVVQTLVQMVVPATQRVEFSGVEMGFISAAELGRWGVVAIWPQSEQFKGIAGAGMVVVAICTGFYTRWIWGTGPSYIARS